MLQLLVEAGKCQSGVLLVPAREPEPEREWQDGAFLGPERNAEMGSPGFFSARECCQSVPVLLVPLFLVMNVGVTTCI